MVVLFSCRLEWCLITKKHKNHSSRCTNLERCIWCKGSLGSLEDSIASAPLGGLSTSWSIHCSEEVATDTACTTWGVNWQGCTVCCHSDNQTVVWVINNFNPKDPLLSHMLRGLFFISAKFDFDLIACHTSGKENTAADALTCHYFLPRSPEQQSPPSTYH